ncbi:TAXI family TRAP transporter solute-binding subunit [Thermanaerosceptrum fracticalcis]|uniref:TAXI family TRAP transporter solute-binding subunit n=1 Tax=Thermanaerosceptrum fracticalcis TaxID=1712410 RepID=A0A7G6DYN5_THEFR|nr:TAXI family TRAP transporter solute-binding subunit [Thermanaerosceptrum fracticalcis]QNB44939.1 TAXI family TRAP transporter solute-binding subunit [Thermanaerosceptrum fracticalcis]
MSKRNTKVFALILVLAFMVTLLGGCSSKTDAPKGEKAKGPAMIQICGATSGGTYFLLANAIAQMLNTKYPNDFKASAQSTAGTPVIVRLLENKEADFGFGQAGIAKDALDGKGGFDKKYSNLASVTYMYPNVMQIPVRKDSGIKSFADFKGKSFAVGASGSATELNSRDMAKIYGLDYLEKKDFKPEFASEAQAVELMKNRQADGANLIAGIGAASVMDLMSSGKYELLSFPDDKIAELQKMNPAYFKYVIPANTYPNQPEPVQTFAVANYIFVRKDLPEDLVYKFTKALYENQADLVAAHKAAKEMKKENAVNGLTVPLHPGAEKYLKEIGAIK